MLFLVLRSIGISIKMIFSFLGKREKFFRVLKIMLFCLPLFRAIESFVARFKPFSGYFMAIIYVVNLSCKQRREQDRKKNLRCLQFNATIYSYTITNNKVVVVMSKSEKRNMELSAFYRDGKKPQQIGQMKTIRSINRSCVAVSCLRQHTLCKLMTIIS